MSKKKPTPSGRAKKNAEVSLVRSSAALLDAAGPLGLLHDGENGALAEGEVEHLYRHSHVETVYGGSSEIQRGIIAQLRLGLPKSR